VVVWSLVLLLRGEGTGYELPLHGDNIAGAQIDRHGAAAPTEATAGMKHAIRLGQSCHLSGPLKA